MTLFGLLLTIVVLCLLVYLVTQLTLPQPFKNIAILVAILLLLTLFYWSTASGVPSGNLRLR